MNGFKPLENSAGHPSSGGSPKSEEGLSLILPQQRRKCSSGLFEKKNVPVVFVSSPLRYYSFRSIQPRRGNTVSPKARISTKATLASLIGAAILAGPVMWESSSSATGAEEADVKGGTLVYVEQQAHTNLYPPAGGFSPNGGILNQITDKLTYQNPKTLEIEPWIADARPSIRGSPRRIQSAEQTSSAFSTRALRRTSTRAGTQSSRPPSP